MARHLLLLAALIASAASAAVLYKEVGVAPYGNNAILGWEINKLAKQHGGLIQDTTNEFPWFGQHSKKSLVGIYQPNNHQTLGHNIGLLDNGEQMYKGDILDTLNQQVVPQTTVGVLSDIESGPMVYVVQKPIGQQTGIHGTVLKYQQNSDQQQKYMQMMGMKGMMGNEYKWATNERGYPTVYTSAQSTPHHIVQKLFGLNPQITPKVDLYKVPEGVLIQGKYYPVHQHQSEDSILTQNMQGMQGMQGMHGMQGINVLEMPGNQLGELSIEGLPYYANNGGYMSPIITEQGMGYNLPQLSDEGDMRVPYVHPLTQMLVQNNLKGALTKGYQTPLNYIVNPQSAGGVHLIHTKLQPFQIPSQVQL